MSATFSIADLRTDIDNEPRVQDVKLASNLGMTQPRNIRSNSACGSLR